MVFRGERKLVTVLHSRILGTQETEGIEIESKEFKASLGYLRFCHKEKTT